MEQKECLEDTVFNISGLTLAWEAKHQVRNPRKEDIGSTLAASGVGWSAK